MDKAIVKAPSCIARLNDSTFPSLANEFRCWSAIQAIAGNPVDAGFAALHAAWVCDDNTWAYDVDSEVAAADICRRDALTLFTQAKEAGQDFAGDAASDLLLLADLYRRTGQFDQVAATCAEGLAHHPELQALFATQQRLAQNRDTQRHTIEQAYALSGAQKPD